MHKLANLNVSVVPKSVLQLSISIDLITARLFGYTYASRWPHSTWNMNIWILFDMICRARREIYALINACVRALSIRAAYRIALYICCRLLILLNYAQIGDNFSYDCEIYDAMSTNWPLREPYFSISIRIINFVV